MSVRVMSMVWASSLPPNERLVLLAYADHANDDGQSIWPGRDAMAAKTGYSEHHVRKITRSLKARGVLIQVADGYRGQRAEYRIDLNALTDLKGGRAGPPIDEGKGTHRDRKGYP